MKLMIVLDYIRVSYADKSGQLAFGNSKAGKEIAKLIEAPRKGLGLKISDVDLEFAYNAVPPLDAQGKPKKLSKKAEKPYFDKLYQAIEDKQPDVILSMGNTALEALVGRKGIDKRRGIPVQKKFGETETIVVPTYSVENIWRDANKAGLFDTDIQMTKGIIKGGMGYFKKGQGDYKLVKDFNEVKTIFTNILNHQYPMIAVDFETNTLHGEYQNVKDKNGTGKKVSAKPIIISLSWKEQMGVAIPLDSHANVWTAEQLRYIYKLIKALFMDDKQWKVMHNGEFDVSFLKKTIGLKYSKKVIDTLLMYYVGVNEDPYVPKGLKHLAYQYTDMGGYEDPLDKYKVHYLKDHYNNWVEDKEAHNEKHPLKDYKAPVNEVDGGTFNYDWIPLDIIYPYAAADTDVCLRIYNKLKPVIKDNPKWKNLIYDFYPKLQDALTTMMANGIYLDQDYAKELKKDYDEELKKVTDQIYQIPEVQMIEDERRDILSRRDKEMLKKPADRDKELVKEGTRLKGVNSHGVEKVKFNPGSVKDKQYLLYNLLGYELPFDKVYLTPKAVKDGVTEQTVSYSDYICDSKEAMPYLVKEYDSQVAKLLLRYSMLNKALNSFIDKLPKATDNKSLLHTNFNMASTVTSRLSSSGLVNMQQIPRRTANPKDFNYKHAIKGMFKSRFENGVLVNIDFKTLEVLVAAFRSQDPSMEQSIIDGADFHSQTARKLFNIPKDQPVLKNLRSKSKAATFGTLYGEGPQGLANSENVPVNEAKQIIDGLMRAYPKLKEAIERDQNMAKSKGYVETVSGFRRRLGTIKSKDKYLASRALRQAFNADIQGSGAYCTNMAVIALHQLFLKAHLKSKLVITVHDSVVVDVHPDEMEAVAKICLYCFSHVEIPEVMYCPINDLKVPDALKTSKTTFRFPLHGELEIGCNYNNDVDFDAEEAKKFKHVYMYAKYEYAKLEIEEKLANKLIDQSQHDQMLNKLEEVKPAFQNK